MNDLTLYLKELEKEEQTKLKISIRSKKKKKIRSAINEMETRKTIEKISKIRAGFSKR